MLTGLQIAPDGTTIVRTDTYGAWISFPRGTGWKNAVSATSMPSTADSVVAVECVAAPSNPAIMYMLGSDGNIYYSINRGLNWSLTAFTTIATINVGLPNKQFGPFMAVDPQNPNIVAVGTPANGVYYTTGGTTGGAWTKIPTASIPAALSPPGSYGGGHLIAFDPTSSVISNVTQGIAISSWGNGVYHTTGGFGGTWAELNSSGMPVTHTDLVYDQFGNLWAVGMQGPIATNASTATSSAVLNFASVPSWIVSGMSARDLTTSTNLSGTVSSTTATTVTMSNDVPATVNSGDSIGFEYGASAIGYLNVYPHSGSTIFTVGQWTQIATGDEYAIASVAIDPAQTVEANSRIYGAGTNNAALYSSQNGGATWFTCQTPTLTGPANGGISWQFNYGNSAFAAGNAFYAGGMIKIRFDPSQSNTLGAVSGINFWTTNPPSNSTASWQWAEAGNRGSGTTGIEQLVINQIVSPWVKKSVPLVVCWDRPIFQVNPSGVAYPAAYGPGLPSPFSAPPQGFSADWASSDPSTIVLITNGVATSPYDTASAVSADGGVTWADWANFPASGYGGCIAASTPTNWCAFPSNNGNPQYTTDGATTAWNDLGSYFNTNFGIPLAGTENGWGYAWYNDYQIICADRVNANTFYAWNYGPPSHTAAQGIYVSTNGGQTWAQYKPVFSYSNAGIGIFLRTVPGNAGHVFINFGTQYNVGKPTYWSTNGGQTWTAIPNVTDVSAYGFGAPSPSTTTGYPTIYFYGKNSGTLGLWRIDNFNSSTGAGTFTNLAPSGYVNNSLDILQWVEGDANFYGIVYVGFRGSGAVVGIF